MKIAIIGAGWYGCHVALELKKIGYTVEVFEKNSTIFSGISGNYGIRLHRGPHYPRSEKTRQICANSFNDFLDLYPELIVEHEHSYYALGITDAHGNKPKVSSEHFNKVCHETTECEDVDVKKTGLRSVQEIYDLKEPSIVLGDRVRSFFVRKLQEANIPVHLNAHVSNILDTETGVNVFVDKTNKLFDFAVNATSFKELAHLTEKIKLPIDLQVTFQTCLSLKYIDRQPEKKVFSFIVMDGWFPCLMPTVSTESYDGSYILTHGCYTIMSSSPTPELAQKILDSYTNDDINEGVKKPCEEDMKRYWPDFCDRFEYVGWKGAVLAKPKTQSEFRGAITFSKGKIVHIIPGKVSTVINAAREAIQLIAMNNCISSQDISYVAGGILDLAQSEIEKHPSSTDISTTNLNIVSNSKESSPCSNLTTHSIFVKPISKSKEKMKVESCCPF